MLGNPFLIYLLVILFSFICLLTVTEQSRGHLLVYITYP